MILFKSINNFLFIREKSLNKKNKQNEYSESSDEDFQETKQKKRVQYFLSTIEVNLLSLNICLLYLFNSKVRDHIKSLWRTEKKILELIYGNIFISDQTLNECENGY